jgi:DUF4097 and DUF4098 domain-containing protein YvlB
MAQEERLMILEMVADKKITASEAVELLKALDGGKVESAGPEPGPDGFATLSSVPPTLPEAPPRPAAPAPPRAPSLPGRAATFGSGLGSFIEEVVERVTTAVTDVVEPPYEFPVTLSGQFVDAEVPLRIITGNGKVRVHTWDEPGFQANVVVKTRGAGEEDARRRAQDAFIAKADEHGFDLESRNPHWGDLTVHVTLNVPKDRRYRLEVRTGNGQVDLGSLSLTEGRVHTGNGRVTCAGGQSDKLSVRSGNGSLEMQMDAADLTAETGNGSISMEPTGDRPQTLRLSSGMGSIRVSSRRLASTAGFKVDAHTGMGGVSVNLPNFAYERDVRTVANKHVIARSANFDQAAPAVTIVASSGMGSVTIE